VKRLENLNYYEILEVDPRASQSEIREAYERAKKTYSRDSIAVYSLLEEDEIREVSRLIDKAYETIGNDRTRREYDKLIGRVEGEGRAGGGSFIDGDLLRSANHVNPGGQERPGQDEGEKIEGIISEEGFEYSGPALRRIRETLGIDLNEISRRTKISGTNLRLIEEENYGRLPALVYLKGFIREYARYLGLDALRVVEDYVKRYYEREREDRDMNPGSG